MSYSLCIFENNYKENVDVQVGVSEPNISVVSYFTGSCYAFIPQYSSTSGIVVLNLDQNGTFVTDIEGCTSVKQVCCICNSSRQNIESI
jgi:hypothetical protein